MALRIAGAAPERVLVTGFADWPKVMPAGENVSDPWRCAHNSSGRVLVGGLGDRARTPPDPPLAGPLVRALSGAAKPYAFRLLPVCWGAFRRLRDVTKFDVLVHLGVGVYERDDVLQLERGAWPWRRGVDVEGYEVDEALAESRRPQLLDAADDASAAPCDDELPELIRWGTSDMDARMGALEGRQFAGFDTRVAMARPDNAYLCNETHWHALGAVAGGAVRRAWFVHVPLTEPERLAAALAALIPEL